jgi:murein DD-endopeptidase MepM/ murein hydrolase activator NlpD
MEDSVTRWDHANTTCAFSVTHDSSEADEDLKKAYQLPYVTVNKKDAHNLAAKMFNSVNSTWSTGDDSMITSDDVWINDSGYFSVIDARSEAGSHDNQVITGITVTIQNNKEIFNSIMYQLDYVSNNHLYNLQNKIIAATPSGMNVSITQSLVHDPMYTFGCNYTFQYKTYVGNLTDKDVCEADGIEKQGNNYIKKEDGGTLPPTSIGTTADTNPVEGPSYEAEFIYDDPYHGDGRFRCTVSITRKVDYTNRWHVSINGVSAAAASLFGDLSKFNTYNKNKLFSQNTGIDVYVKETGQTRDDVDMVITSTLATDDNFMLTANDYSFFAFFSESYQEEELIRRSWFSVDEVGVVELGEGTSNKFNETALWDIPILKRLGTSPTGYSTVMIVEEFGKEKDIVTGGIKNNNGITFQMQRGSAVYSALPGTVVGVGYNQIYGDYVEVQYSGNIGIISTVDGLRYEITEFKIVYGYLLSQALGGTEVYVGQDINAGEQIGIVGTSGRTTGNQLYFAIKVSAKEIDDDIDGATIEIAHYTDVYIDPTPYFTSKFELERPADFNFEVYFK